ncbi:MAG: hypothetical protein AB1757_24915 [Acidobacteriota bacterium]
MNAQKKSLWHIELKKLLAFAALFHVTITLIIFLAGRFNLLPNLFDGNGTIQDSDSQSYLATLVQINNSTGDQGISGLWSNQNSAPVNFYILPFVIFSKVFGANILSIELLNVAIYLGILAIVFKLTEQLFARRAAIVATLTVGLLPSLLIHTTQILRDPAFIFATLLLIFIFANLLDEELNWRRAIVILFIGCATVYALSIIRDNMWELTLALIGLGVVMLTLRQIIERRFLLFNSAIAVILLVVAISIEHDYRTTAVSTGDLNAVSQSDSPAVSNSPAVTNNSQEDSQSTAQKKNLFAALILRACAIRNRMAMRYRNDGSTIDAEVRFSGWRDLLGYSPRALFIGLFAPFPDMWLSPSKSIGAGARLLSGIETLVMYVVEIFAMLAVYRNRKKQSVWFLLLAALLGVMTLGMFLVNVGGLYRARYGFWILFIILGSKVLADWFKTSAQLLVNSHG